MVSAIRMTTVMLCLAIAVPSEAAAPRADDALRIPDTALGMIPVPSAERGLATATATPWTTVSVRSSPLEGPVFDREGNFLVMDVGADKVVSIGRDGRRRTVFQHPGIGMGGLAIHRDGRVFVAATGDGKAGLVAWFRPGEKELHVVISQSAGFVPNDLAFDAHGGL